MNSPSPKVGIIMGSLSDWPTLENSAKMLTQLGISWESKVVSAHRTPKRLYDYAETAAARGIQCIIAGAGGAAHLPGMAAAITPLPVLAVPVKSSTLNGVDSLLSIVQMPAGIPTATFAIGVAGATNAALFAAAIFAATGDETISKNLNEFRANQTAKIEEGELPQMADIEAQQK